MSKIVLTIPRSNVSTLTGMIKTQIAFDSQVPTNRSFTLAGPTGPRECYGDVFKFIKELLCKKIQCFLFYKE